MSIASDIIKVDELEAMPPETWPVPLLAVASRTSGDISRVTGGTLIDMRDRNRILAFDPGTGIMVCEAGLRFATLLATAAPARFFPPVMARSANETIGGAVARDISGRNHVARGALGDHVRSLTLLNGQGEIMACSRAENADLFEATIGGLGLTGIILTVELQLMKVPSAHLQRHMIRFRSLDEGLALMEDRIHMHEYVHAWLDGTDAASGRGILIAADHGDASSEPPPLPVRKPVTMPMVQPFNFINNLVVRIGSHIPHLLAGRRESVKTVAWWSYFWPLRRLRGHERLAGYHDIHTLDCVLPLEAVKPCHLEIQAALHAAGHLSFYTELTRIGEGGVTGLLSLQGPAGRLRFHLVGHGDRTRMLMTHIAGLIGHHGGCLIPGADVEPPADQMAMAFPRLEVLETRRDRAFSSVFWKRAAVSGTN